MSLKSLVADPEFKALSSAEQKQAIVGVEPEAANLNSEDYATFISSLSGSVAEQPQENKYMKGINDFGSGAMEGASFGAATIDRGGNVKASEKKQSLPGSIMQGDGSAKEDFTSRYSGVKGAGRAMGSLIPMVVSELLAGAPAKALVLKYGMGPVESAMTQTGITMANYEGLKGGAEGAAPLETVNNMARGYILGMPMGAAGYGISKGAEKLANSGAEGLADQYLYTAPKVNQAQKQAGKPSVGRKFLNETPYDSTMSKDAVYGDINKQLENNRMLIRNKLQQADEAAMRQPETSISGTPQLEYKPTQVETRTENPYQFPQMKARPRRTDDPELIHLPNKNLETLDEPHGDYYQRTDSPRVGKGTHFGGRYANETPGMGEEARRAQERTIAESSRQPGRMAAPVSNPKFVDLNEVRAAAQPLLAEQSDIGNKAASGAIDSLMGDVAAGETTISNERAYDLLTKLDAEVNKAYSAIDQNTIPPGTEARAAMANRLRELLRRNVPEVSDILAQNHTLMQSETGLLPQVSSGPLIKRAGDDWLKPMIHKAIGGRAGLGAARRLDAINMPGTLSNNIVERAVKPAAANASKLGMAEYLDTVQNKKKEKPSGRK